MKKLFTADRETGTIIDEVKSVNEGLKLIKEYEKEDKAEGNYEPGFYEIVDEDHGTIYSDYYGLNKMGGNLKAMRNRRGISQAELADKSGVSLRLIQAYEQGYRDINEAQVMTVLNLADALRCDVRDIING